MSKISGAVHLMLPSQPPGIHAKSTLNVLVASQQTQHNEPTLASHWPIDCGTGPTFSQHCHNLSCLVEEIIILVASPAVNTQHLYSIYELLAQRRRRWAEIV